MAAELTPEIRNLLHATGLKAPARTATDAQIADNAKYFLDLVTLAIQDNYVAKSDVDQLVVYANPLKWVRHSDRVVASTPLGIYTLYLTDRSEDSACQDVAFHSLDPEEGCVRLKEEIITLEVAEALANKDYATRVAGLIHAFRVSGSEAVSKEGVVAVPIIEQE